VGYLTVSRQQRDFVEGWVFNGVVSQLRRDQRLSREEPPDKRYGNCGCGCGSDAGDHRQAHEDDATLARGRVSDSPGYRREDVQFALRADAAFESVDVSDVAAIDHDGDEATDRAIFVEELIVQAFVLAGEAFEDAADRVRRVGQINAATAHERSQRCVKADLHRLLAAPHPGPLPRGEGVQERRLGDDLELAQFGFADDAVVPAARLVVLLLHLVEFTDVAFCRTAGWFGQEALGQ